MSTDWLPRDAKGARTIPSHVYTEPCWTRTVKGHLWDRRKVLKHLYELFDLFKENSRVLAEGSSVAVIFEKLDTVYEINIILSQNISFI